MLGIKSKPKLRSVRYGARIVTAGARRYNWAGIGTFTPLWCRGNTPPFQGGFVGSIPTSGSDPPVQRLARQACITERRLELATPDAHPSLSRAVAAARG